MCVYLAPPACICMYRAGMAPPRGSRCYYLGVLSQYEHEIVSPVTTQILGLLTLASGLRTLVANTQRACAPYPFCIMAAGT